jgi:chemotaxis protein methyltransferase CheR
LAFDRLSSALADDGWLMLGAGETVIGQTKKLVSDAKVRGLYRLDNRDKSDRRAGDERRSAARG